MEQITYRASARARRITAHITAEGVVVVYPAAIDRRQAELFVEKYRSKIEEKAETHRRHPGGIPKASWFCPDSVLHTLTFDVVIRSSDEEHVAARMQDGILTLRYPRSRDYRDLQDTFGSLTTYFLRQEARRVLPPMVRQQASACGLHYNSVGIRSSRTRWGSCSSNGNISLSLFLLILPRPLIEFVILHELCHTREMNHGPRFHALLDQLTGGREEEFSRELKRYHIPRW